MARLKHRCKDRQTAVASMDHIMARLLVRNETSGRRYCDLIDPIRQARAAVQYRLNRETSMETLHSENIFKGRRQALRTKDANRRRRWQIPHVTLRTTLTAAEETAPRRTLSLTQWLCYHNAFYRQEALLTNADARDNQMMSNVSANAPVGQ